MITTTNKAQTKTKQNKQNQQKQKEKKKKIKNTNNLSVISRTNCEDIEHLLITLNFSCVVDLFPRQLYFPTIISYCDLMI